MKNSVELYERVKQAERRYESLFNASADPIVVLDMEGRILDLNQRAAEMLGRPRTNGCTPSALGGAHFCDVLQMSHEECQAAIAQVREGQRLSFKMQMPSEEGVRTLEVHVARIDYGDQEAIQWVGHDISEWVALERMREDLAHMIVHDLRNPLGSIMSSLQLISTAYVEQDETVPVLKLVRIAMRSGQKLYRLIDTLLDLGRLEAGETELKKTSVSPESLVHEAVEQMQPFALNREQRLVTRVRPGLPRVPADNELILRVLTNLLDNAVKFTPREGQITLSVEQVEAIVIPSEARNLPRDVPDIRKGVQFAVSDTGPGIPAESLQHVFDRFGRLEHAPGFKGTGLGLAFCRVAVEAHGGRIWVESEVGRGTTFYFILPLEGS